MWSMGGEGVEKMVTGKDEAGASSEVKGRPGQNGVPATKKGGEVDCLTGLSSIGGQGRWGVPEHPKRSPCSGSGQRDHEGHQG